MALRVKALFIYPVKSCQGIQVDEAEISKKGFKYDRYWMIVDGKGDMVTQRKMTRLGSIGTKMVQKDGQTGVELTWNGERPITVWEKDESDIRQTAEVFGGVMKNALVCGEDVNTWLDEALGAKVPTYKLLQCPKDEKRDVEMDMAVNVPGEGYTTGFADGFPYLALLQSSLDEINKKASESASFDSNLHTLDVRRFRPNILIEGDVIPNDDDDWHEVQIGKGTFHFVTACERCVLTTINPDTQKMDQRMTPSNALTLLNKYRNFGRGALFGQNCVSQSHETIVRKGDTVYVTSRRTATTKDHDLGKKPSSLPSCGVLSLFSVLSFAAAVGLAIKRSKPNPAQ
eukprot:TRINITY_DN775_c1_g1_i1.p1 TRINITY_DN775_c1_g1~~TRINITY_DN775_c1_g1_i1.p1  ORF type:complete len:359 (+),score=70.64 TRINITY_DN775_c1_g1_i1:50-1078(+)